MNIDGPHGPVKEGTDHITVREDFRERLRIQSLVGASAPLPPPRRSNRPARTVPVRAGRAFLTLPLWGERSVRRERTDFAARAHTAFAANPPPRKSCPMR